MLNCIAIWVGVYLFGLGGPLQNATAQRSVPVSNDVVRRRQAARLLGRPGAAGPAHRASSSRSPRCSSSGSAQPLDDRLRGARGRLQPRGRAVRRHQRRAQLHPGDGRLRRLRRAGRRDGRARLAVPHRHERHPRSRRSASSASPSRCSGRNTAGRHGCFAALLFGALLSGTSQRNLDPTIFEPELASNLTLDHPGPRRAVRQRRRARARDAALGRGGSCRRRSRTAPQRRPTRAPRPREHRRRDGRRRARRERAPRRAGAAIALGVVAWFITLPPVLVRTPVPSVADRRCSRSAPARGRSAAASAGSAGARSSAGVVGARRRGRRRRSRASATSRTSSRGRRCSRRCCATRRR